MRIAVRMALVGLGLLATGMNVLGQTAGFKYKLFPQAKACSTVAILYVTLPTARPGLGAGAMAHLVQFLVSKDFGKHHFDVNEGCSLWGEPS